ncbi:TPA: 50S ribosomal protein L24e [Candidatus Micrarchaeota archaeon]|nr:50S ribosomal protein L24e [Candidatus Micrarchaeota archaeon]
MVSCTHCGTQVPVGTGFIVFKRDGTGLNYCSRKCLQNSTKMNRNPRKQKWTAHYVKGKTESSNTRSARVVGQASPTN